MPAQQVICHVMNAGHDFAPALRCRRALGVRRLPIMWLLSQGTFGRDDRRRHGSGSFQKCPAITPGAALLSIHSECLLGHEFASCFFTSTYATPAGARGARRICRYSAPRDPELKRIRTMGVSDGHPVIARKFTQDPLSTE